MKKTKKNLIVFVGSISSLSKNDLLTYIEQKNKKWELQILKQPEHNNGHAEDYAYVLDFDNQEEIKKWVHEFGNRIVAITARSEKNIPLFQKIIPYLPAHVLTPTVESLKKSIEKTEMRKAFQKYDSDITPKFKIFKSFEDINIESIAKNFEFPVIVKPSGLASSLLIQSAHYPEELQQVITNIKNKITKVYDTQKGRGAKSILIEEIIEGDVYSVDAYTDNDGKTYFMPFVKYTTSAQKGFDDFFLYERTIPSKLSKEKRNDAKNIALKGINALGLRNTTTHIELIFSEDGWKIIEIGPRIGGNREMMYEQCYGISHNINDILVRANKTPITKSKRKGYITTIQFFPQQEGYIKKITGIKKASLLPSHFETKQKLKKGDRSLHAKNGGAFVTQITLFNENKAQFIEDKRKLEKMIHIETTKMRNKK